MKRANRMGAKAWARLRGLPLPAPCRGRLVMPRCKLLAELTVTPALAGEHYSPRLAPSRCPRAASPSRCTLGMCVLEPWKACRGMWGVQVPGRGFSESYLDKPKEIRYFLIGTQTKNGTVERRIMASRGK